MREHLKHSDLVVVKRIWEKERADGRVFLDSFYSTPDLRRVASTLRIDYLKPHLLPVFEAGSVRRQEHGGSSREKLIELILDAVYELRDLCDSIKDAT